MNLGLAFPGVQQKQVENITAVSTLVLQEVEMFVFILFTLILNCEVGGDERWNLPSDVCTEDLSPKLCFVLLYHLGLK